MLWIQNFTMNFSPFSRILLLQNKAKETSFIGLAVLFSALFSGSSSFFFIFYFTSLMNMWLIIFIALLTGRKARSVDCLEADDIDSFLQTNLLTFFICELFNLSFQLTYVYYGSSCRWSTVCRYIFLRFLIPVIKTSEPDGGNELTERKKALGTRLEWNLHKSAPITEKKEEFGEGNSRKSPF